jgi:hypothetical protein
MTIVARNSAVPGVPVKKAVSNGSHIKKATLDNDNPVIKRIGL